MFLLPLYNILLPYFLTRCKPLFLSSKCNPDTVELLPLNKPEDIKCVKRLLEEFVEKTGSLIAQDLLKFWPEPTTRFVKVSTYKL